MEHVLFGDAGSCPETQKARAAAAFVGAKVKMHPPCCEESHGRTALKTPCGEVIRGGDVVARYFGRMRADLGLCGRTFVDMALVDCWMSYISEELQGSLEKKAEVGKALEKLNAHLLHHTYMVGERVTLADVALAIVISYGLEHGLDQEELQTKYPSLYRLHMTVGGNPVIANIVRGGQQKAPGKKAPEKQAPEKKQSPEDIEKQIEAESKAKSKAPGLDSLPPSNFNMDEWKRVYSNTTNLRGEALPWFWENIDTDGYSFWYMKYDKLPDECTKAFQTCNQLGGFLQRLEPAFRKYSFAVNNVVGEEGNYDIIGVWLLRGQEVPSFLKEHPSIEYHKLTRLDHTKAADKKLIEDYWVEDEKVEGRPIASSKVWK